MSFIIAVFLNNQDILTIFTIKILAMLTPNKYKWMETAIRLQAIAQSGLEYCRNEFDLDRYMQIRSIAVEIIENHSSHEKDEIIGFFASDTGYPTPKVDVRAAIFKEDKILLIKEKIDGRWALPGGWADTHLSIKENLIKESKEEAGVDVLPMNIIAIHDRSHHNYPPIPHGCYKLFVECKLLGGEFSKNTETSDSGFFSLENLPELSTERNVPEQIKLCFEKRGQTNGIEFD